jgi:GNAT superfamily N-acetyltransferase
MAGDQAAKWIMINITRTNSDDPDFIKLVKLLDADLAKRDGKDHSFYAQFNQIDSIKYVAVAYENEEPIGCGAIKEYESDTVEIKRMYVSPESRDKGIATKILSELENWAAELSFAKCILETGKKQPEAVRLYEKNGYKLIPNYGQYAGVENSLCFEKNINQKYEK